MNQNSHCTGCTGLHLHFQNKTEAKHKQNVCVWGGFRNPTMVLRCLVWKVVSECGILRPQNPPQEKFTSQNLMRKDEGVCVFREKSWKLQKITALYMVLKVVSVYRVSLL